MTALVRAACLQGYEALARSIGVDVERELARVGLSTDSLADPDALIPYVSRFHLLEHTAVSGHCPDFGLRLSESQGADVLGPLSVLLRHAATLADAMDLASRHLFVHSPAVRFNVLPVASRPSEVDLALSFELPHLPPCGQSLELVLGLLACVMREITQARVRPLLALIPHARIGPARSYTRVLDCECRFEAPSLALRIPAAQLARPLPGHNPMLRQLAQNYVDQHLGSRDRIFADLVRSMVRRLIGSGQATQADIAGRLSIHTRTMQRRLLDEGQRYEDIVDAVRKEMLVDLLGRSPALSLSQIALMLGYSEQAALTRACRRLFGCTPTELRETRAAALRPGAVTAAP
ncbi:MAG: AraC family transcriptional regulator [Burkholderiales bacterium]|nr:AraC family transcriptional regulator [Burkholderiales bacterium]